MYQGALRLAFQVHDSSFVTFLLILPCFSSGNEGQREKEELQQKFSILRPEVLETLRMRNLLYVLLFSFFSGLQEGVDMRRRHFPWPNITKILLVLLLSATGKQFSPLKKTRTPNEYSRTSSNLRRILQQNFSSGIYNMVGSHNFTIS
jgi:hypothetical protein